ncbi:FmdB family zinc ribbon protein [Haloimpatiens lingqiaonensis]|uniref:FmdB family zinc ribbon protein n=1 Tax=Haloimpatiens lingqiaonensis TaxID=1380675 RepID=UPI0010FDEB6E|nr:FmdB family zinc ribbon protein [Haloimpatiens lingqiaonensis]
MPVIDFKCKKCGSEFFEIAAHDEQVECPKCGSNEVERVYKGKYYGKGNCSGNCSCCGGCH